MNGPLRSAHDQPLTIEGAKLYLVLEEVDRIVVTLQTLNDAAVQRETDRQSAVVAEQRTHWIEEQAVAHSIAQAVIVNIHAEMDLDKERELNAAVLSAHATELMSATTGIIRVSGSARPFPHADFSKA